MKKIRQILMFVIILFISCNSPETNVKNMLSEYINARYMKFNLTEAYNYISSVDQEIKSQSKYVSENEAPAIKYLIERVQERQTFDIHDITIKNDTALVSVQLTTIDAETIFKETAGDLLGVAFQSIFNDDTTNMSQEKLTELIQKKYENNDIPIKTMVKEFTLIREPIGWRVFHNWKTEVHIKELFVQADSYVDMNQYSNAISMYDSILALKPQNENAKDGKKKAELALKELKEKQEYMSNVVIENFKVGMGRQYSFSDPEQGIFGTIVNNGKRTLSKVKIRVYFLDTQGNPIAEEDYTPVLVSEFSFTDNKPLRPGYVKDFGYTIEDAAPSRWGGKVNAEVIDIEFQDESETGTTPSTSNTKVSAGLNNGIQNVDIPEEEKAVKIKNISFRIGEINEHWWAHAWKLTIENNSNTPISIDGTIKFLDREGYTLDSVPLYNVQIPAKSERTLSDTKLIDADVAPKVAKISAEISR